MTNYKLDTSAGDSINKVAKRAKEIASMEGFKGYAVEFDFNGIKCLVNKDTVVDWLVRDYMNAHIMGWKQVGAECLMQYEPEVEIELYRRKLARAEKRKKDMEEYEKNERQKELLVKEKVKDCKMEFSDKEGWDSWKAKNTDGYGNAVFVFAESWARLMQVEINKGVALKDCAQKASEEADYVGLSGFQYGVAVSVLSKTWKHGEDLRKWHNKDYGHEGEGVVNPAILTIG